MTFEAVVIGGGIAGLAAAQQLGAKGLRDVVVLEREPVTFAHASGQNAAIFRAGCASRVDVRLAVRSAELLDGLFGGDRGEWLARTGALYVASDRRRLEPIAAACSLEGVEWRWASEEELTAAVGSVSVAAACGIVVPGDGVLNGHAIAVALEREIRRGGGSVRTRAEVAAVTVEQGRVRGVRLMDGEELVTARVIIAAGAWAKPLGATCGAPLPVTALRRHIAVLEPRSAVRRDAPVVWKVDDEVYFRPESGGVLASPCDEDAWEPEFPPANPETLELLARKLSALSPALAESQVRRHWAGLRTFAADRNPIIGADPRVGGLFWVAGLGGHGMTGGLAAGELLARSVMGEVDAFAAQVAPAHLVQRR